MRYLLFIITAAVFLCYSAAAQGLAAERPVREHCTGDLDGDFEEDAVWYDVLDSAIVFKLSSRGYEEFGVKYYLEEESFAENHLFIDDGVFSITTAHMRGWESYSYRYDAGAGRFRLAEYYHESCGNAVSDASGSMSLDFLDNWFTADWNYYDYEKKELVALPTVVVYVNNPVIYFGDDTDFEFPGYDLYDSYKEAYEPPYTDTLRLVGFEYDYDYPVMVSAGADGDDCYNLVMCNYEELYRGDLVSATTSICFYQEPGEGESYRARMAISDIELVDAGPLRRFMESNRKAIDYADDSQYADRWDARRIDAMNYYFAVTHDKRVARAMRRPGGMRVLFRDYDTWLNDSVLFTAEIYDDGNGHGDGVDGWDGVKNGELNPLRTLVLRMHGDFDVEYWLVNGRNGTWKQLKID